MCEWIRSTVCVCACACMCVGKLRDLGTWTSPKNYALRVFEGCTEKTTYAVPYIARTYRPTGWVIVNIAFGSCNSKNEKKNKYTYIDYWCCLFNYLSTEIVSYHLLFVNLAGINWIDPMLRQWPKNNVCLFLVAERIIPIGENERRIFTNKE